MDTEKGRTRQHIKEVSHVDEEKEGCELNESKKEENSRKTMTAQEEIVSVSENKPAHPTHNICSNPSSSGGSSSEDTQHFSKPSLSYIALISKVILSSPSQKLNLSSIYRTMEEQFPYLRSRGPGWRNSVRHNLSVNDCFVKVSRCEDGRGHYWGVHQAHLKDFQRGNFRQYRKVRGRRERERYDRMVGCLAWMETNCFLSSFCDNSPNSLSRVESQCPLQEPKMHQMSSLDWAKVHYQPWSFNMGWAGSPNWMRCCFFPERLPDLYDQAVAGRGQCCEALTHRLHSWETSDPRGMKDSYDSGFMTSPLQHSPFSSPGCWCTSPVIKELIKPFPYKVNYVFHP
ncbi:hypothetical protein LDENG_00236200 [Lucifuga dentata]|nr:hypothetical protein LDENG_00236200 [Lucifuga dentata]